MRTVRHNVYYGHVFRVQKSHEKSKNILEEKHTIGQAKVLHKNDQQVYKNCFKLRSRAIELNGLGFNEEGFGFLPEL